MTDFGSNFKELCRLCASLDAIKMDIFGDKGKERKLADKIRVCLPIQVSEEDLLPKSLCYRCIYNLENYFDFRKSCMDATNKLETYVRETWGNALELQYKPRKNVNDTEQDGDQNSMLGGHSNYSDSQETPNPADFLEACMDNEPIQSSPPSYQQNPYEQEQVIEVNSGSFVCPSCPLSFSNMSALILHSKVHMGGGTLAMTSKKDAVRLFSCPVCDKAFVSKGNLSNHIKVHSTEGYPQVQERPFHCELCSKSYTVAKHLWGHVSTAHRGDPRVTCPFCSRIFSTGQNLDDHCKTKHADEYPGMQEQMELCLEKEDSKEAEQDGDKNSSNFTAANSDLATNSSLAEELSNSRRKNSNPRRIQRDPCVDNEQSNQSKEELLGPGDKSSICCLLCGQLFGNRNDLRKHILGTHGIDPADVGYPDTEMDELSIQRQHQHHPDESEMVESMLEAETVFCCEVCIREFNDRASLWLHMLYSHREEASTACGICLRVCSDNVSLLEHVDSCHPRATMANDKRRYSCQICARQHDSRKKLLAHVKIHNLKDADGHALDPESMIVLNSDYYGIETPVPSEGLMDDEFSMSCEMCYKTFPTELKLIKHKRNAHKDSEAMHSSNSSATYKLFFPCEVCGLSHSTRTERWRHVFTCHSDEPTLVCEKECCRKVFPTKSLKYEHSKSHHELQGDTPNTCEICGKLWATRMNYWKHMMGVHGDCLPFICGVCLKVFCNVTDLAAHVKEKHYPLDNSEDFCCDICGRPYSKKSKMSRHRKIHNLSRSEGGLEDGLFDLRPPSIETFNNPAVLRCDECPEEQFEDLEELSEHRRSAHDLAPCDLCPKFYGRTSHLWKHVYKIHKTHPDITCSICQKTSASRVHLAKHYAKHHRDYAPPGENDYVSWQDAVNNSVNVRTCSKCNKVFRKDHLMKQHIKHCSGPKPNNPVIGQIQSINGSYPCEKCSRVFEQQGLLNKHVKSAHVVYTCEICDVSKDTKTDLFDHIKAEHLNHPELTCDVESCMKMLRVKKDATKHKREHRQGYQGPTCEFCGEILQNKLKIRKHLRSNHPNQTKYMCSICTISHLTFEELQEHIKEKHPSSIGKPTTCSICARKCPTKYKLETHLKTHGDEFYNCLTCFAVFRKAEEFKQHCKIHPPKKSNASKSQNTTKDEDDEEDSDKEEDEEGRKRKHSPDNGDKSKLMKLTQNCVCCKSTFSSKSELLKHQLDNHSDLKCKTCNVFYDSEESLVNHTKICRAGEGRAKRRSALKNSSIYDRSGEDIIMKTYDSDEEYSNINIFSQNNVDETSSNSKDHWVTHSSRYSGGRKVYDNDNVHSPCEHCDKTWPAKRALWQHLIRSHKLEAATSCGVCLKFCKTYYDLDMHLAEAHPRNFEEDDSNSTCRICGRYHNARSKLQLHAAIHPGEEHRCAVLNHDCSRCDMTFSSRGFLTKHEIEKHNISKRDTSSFLKEDSKEKVFSAGMFSDDDDTGFPGFPVESSDVINHDDDIEATEENIESPEMCEAEESSKGSPSSELHETEENEKDEAMDDDIEEVSDSSSSSSSSSSSDDDDDDEDDDDEEDDDIEAEEEEDEDEVGPNVVKVEAGDDDDIEAEEEEDEEEVGPNVVKVDADDDDIEAEEEDEEELGPDVDKVVADNDDDIEAEEEVEEDVVPDDEKIEAIDEDEEIEEVESFAEETATENDEAVANMLLDVAKSQDCSIGEEDECTLDMMNKDDIELDTELEDSEAVNSVLDSVNSYQPVQSLDHFSRQSDTLDDSSLQLSYKNETNMYIAQNITDADIENLVS